MGPLIAPTANACAMLARQPEYTASPTANRTAISAVAVNITSNESPTIKDIARTALPSGKLRMLPPLLGEQQAQPVRLAGEDAAGTPSDLGSVDMITPRWCQVAGRARLYRA